MTVLTLCGALYGALAATPAQAQGPKLGTVLGIPLNELAAFRQANTISGTGFYGERIPANDVAVLHISAAAGAPINSAVATVSITQQGTDLKAWRVYFPQNGNGSIPPLYQYINARDSFTNPRSLTTSVGGVVQMDVRQEDTGNSELESVRFLLLPRSAYGSLESENPGARFTVVHNQVMTNNFGPFWTQLVAIDLDSARGLTIPTSMTSAIQALNGNLSVGPGNQAGLSLAEVR
jgi:hypothetical protein